MDPLNNLKLALNAALVSVIITTINIQVYLIVQHFIKNIGHALLKIRMEVKRRVDNILNIFHWIAVVRKKNTICFSTFFFRIFKKSQ
jgi:hypothetical protein